MKRALFFIALTLFAFTMVSCGGGDDDDDTIEYTSTAPTKATLESGSGCWALDKGTSVFVRFRDGKFWYFDNKKNDMLLAWDYKINGTTLTLTQGTVIGTTLTFRFTLKVERGFYRTGEESLLITDVSGDENIKTGHYAKYAGDILGK